MKDSYCQRCRALLSAALDQETTPQENAFIREHLQTCEDCLQAQAAYRSIRNQFHTLSHPMPSAQLRTAVMAGTVGGGRAVVPARGRTVSGLQPLLNFGQKLALGGIALLLVGLVGAIIIGILRTPPFEVEGQPTANATDQKVVVTFSRPLDRTYIQANADKLFEVRDATGNKVEMDWSKVAVVGSTVELPVLPDGNNKIELNDKLQVDVKPEIKDESGTKVSNPGMKSAKVEMPPPATATPTRSVARTTQMPPTTVVTSRPTTAPPSTAPPTQQASTAPTDTAAVIPTRAATTAPATPRPTTPPTTMVVRPTTPAATTIAATTIAATTIAVTTTVPVSTTLPAPTTAAVTATPSQSPVPVPSVTTTPVITVTATITATSDPPQTTVAPTTTGAVTTAPATTVAPKTAPATTAAPTTMVASTVCRVDMRRGFGKLYNERADLAPRLGCPQVVEAQARLVYQAFQRGFMVWHQQSDAIYVFYNTGTWARYAAPGSAPTATPSTPAPTPLNSCASTPLRGFGSIWTTYPVVRNGLGCPVNAENSTEVAAHQPFERGQMLFNPLAVNGRRIYVVFNDGAYLDLPDTFVG